MNRPLLWIASGLALVYGWIVFSPAIRVIVWPDSLVYLVPALDAIEHGYFSHAGGRGFVYPAVLWAALRADSAPRGIVVLQRAAVFATYMCLAAGMLTAAAHAMRVRQVAPAAAIAAAAFWLVVFVLYPPLPGLAHAIGPESVFALLVTIVAAGSVWVAVAARSRAGTAAVIALVVVTNCAAVLVRPHWLLGAVLVAVTLPLVAPRELRRAATAAVASTVIVSVAVLGVVESSLQRRYDPYMPVVQNARHLFCSSADLIHADLGARPLDPVSAQVRDALGRILSAEARAAATDWTLPGFNVDLCTYGETVQIIAAAFVGRPSAERAYYLDTYFRALAARPGYLPARWARSAAAVLRRPLAAAATDYFVRADPGVLSANAARPLLAQWNQQHRDLFNGVVDLPSRRRPMAARMLFAGAGFMLIAAVLAAMVRGVRLRRCESARPLVACFALVGGSVLAINLLIATVHTFEPRYLAMQAPLLILLGFSATLVALTHRQLER